MLQQQEQRPSPFFIYKPGGKLRDGCKSTELTEDDFVEASQKRRQQYQDPVAQNSVDGSQVASVKTMRAKSKAEVVAKDFSPDGDGGAREQMGNFFATESMRVDPDHLFRRWKKGDRAALFELVALIRSVILPSWTTVCETLARLLELVDERGLEGEYLRQFSSEGELQKLVTVLVYGLEGGKLKYRQREKEENQREYTEDEWLAWVEELVRSHGGSAVDGDLLREEISEAGVTREEKKFLQDAWSCTWLTFLAIRQTRSSPDFLPLPRWPTAHLYYPLIQRFVSNTITSGKQVIHHVIRKFTRVVNSDTTHFPPQSDTWFDIDRKLQPLTLPFLTAVLNHAPIPTSEESVSRVTNLVLDVWPDDPYRDQLPSSLRRAMSNLFIKSAYALQHRAVLEHILRPRVWKILDAVWRRTWRGESDGTGEGRRDDHDHEDPGLMTARGELESMQSLDLLKKADADRLFGEGKTSPLDAFFFVDYAKKTCGMKGLAIGNKASYLFIDQLGLAEILSRPSAYVTTAVAHIELLVRQLVTDNTPSDAINELLLGLTMIPRRDREDVASGVSEARLSVDGEWMRRMEGEREEVMRANGTNPTYHSGSVTKTRISNIWTIGKGFNFAHSLFDTSFRRTKNRIVAPSINFNTTAPILQLYHPAKLVTPQFDDLTVVDRVVSVLRNGGASNTRFNKDDNKTIPNYHPFFAGVRPSTSEHRPSWTYAPANLPRLFPRNSDPSARKREKKMGRLTRANDISAVHEFTNPDKVKVVDHNRFKPGKGSSLPREFHGNDDMADHRRFFTHLLEGRGREELERAGMLDDVKTRALEALNELGRELPRRDKLSCADLAYGITRFDLQVLWQSVILLSLDANVANDFAMLAETFAFDSERVSRDLVAGGNELDKITLDLQRKLAEKREELSIVDGGESVAARLNRITQESDALREEARRKTESCIDRTVAEMMKVAGLVRYERDLTNRSNVPIDELTHAHLTENWDIDNPRTVVCVTGRQLKNARKPTYGVHRTPRGTALITAFVKKVADMGIKMFMVQVDEFGTSRTCSDSLCRRTDGSRSQTAEGTFSDNKKPCHRVTQCESCGAPRHRDKCSSVGIGGVFVGETLCRKSPLSGKRVRGN